MEDRLLRGLLDAEGYTVSAREDGFATVLVSRSGERWLGHGPDQESALKDAVHRMFPSAASRALLERALGSWETAPGPTVEQLAEGADAPPPPEPPPAALAVEEVTTANELEVREQTPPAPSAAEPERAEPISQPEEELAGVSADLAVHPRPRVDDRDAAVSEEDPAELDETDELATVVDLVPEEDLLQERPRCTPGEALEGLANLRAVIDDLMPEVAWMAPRLVRLQLTAWLARARALQEASWHHHAVEQEVRRLAGRLGGVTKRWWPGNVTALQLHTAPEQVSKNLGLGLGSRPDWDDVADAIENVLDETNEGWADDSALEPRPVSVDAAFDRITTNLEALLGPLDREPGHGALAHIDDTETRKALQEWARRLRWMRGVAPSGERWARAMGHLRWVLQHAPKTRRYLDAALDPDRSPREGTWAKALGEDPDRRRRRKRVRKVLRATPSPEASAELVAAWLALALGLGADLTNRQVLGLLPQHHEVVLGLTPEELGDVGRSVRSRLRKLQKSLRNAEPPVAAPELEDEPDESDGDEEGVDPVATLADAVRDRVAGKRAVFVSNRKDPELQAKLEKRLGLKIEWCEGSPRRVQSVAKQVEAGTYDFVILATGFSGHSNDAVLGKAASQRSVPFVRAYKGRPLATLRALARDLGIRHERT
ncbi:MAG: hypothetical protein GY898_30965 [Proteobacteria bacterium]|nr:hypothetical protein [Pseudomonadota bacterium]